MESINFERGKDPRRSMGVGVVNYIEIERIFLKVVDRTNNVLDKGMMSTENGHLFFQKVVNQRIIDWDLIAATFPHLESDMRAQLCKVQITFLGPRGQGIGTGSHPAYFRFQVAGRTIHYHGEFYDLPEKKSPGRMHFFPK